MKYLLIFLISLNCHAITFTSSTGLVIDVTQSEYDEMQILKQVSTYDCDIQDIGYDRKLCKIVKKLVYHTESIVIKRRQ